MTMPRNTSNIKTKLMILIAACTFLGIGIFIGIIGDYRSKPFQPYNFQWALSNDIPSLSGVAFNREGGIFYLGLNLDRLSEIQDNFDNDQHLQSYRLKFGESTQATTIVNSEYLYFDISRKNFTNIMKDIEDYPQTNGITLIRQLPPNVITDQNKIPSDYCRIINFFTPTEINAMIAEMELAGSCDPWSTYEFMQLLNPEHEIYGHYWIYYDELLVMQRIAQDEHGDFISFSVDIKPTTQNDLLESTNPAIDL